MKELLTFFVMAAVTAKDESKVILNRPHTGGCEQRILLDTDIAQEGGAKTPAVLHIWTFISGLRWVLTWNRSSRLMKHGTRIHIKHSTAYSHWTTAAVPVILSTSSRDLPVAGDNRALPLTTSNEEREDTKCGYE